MDVHEEEKKNIQDEREYDEVMEILNNPATEQTKILAEILSRNAETEYLRNYKLDGATDVKWFREKVPVSDYGDYKPFVDRIVKGEKAPLLAADPVTQIWTSSGTSEGVPKMFAMTDESMARRAQMRDFYATIVKRILPERPYPRKLYLFFFRESVILESGLLCHPGSTSFYRSLTMNKDSKEFKMWHDLAGPPELFASLDRNASMYCHLLLSLAHRDQIGRISCIFPTVFIRAMRCLEEWWPELCDDIENGFLSTKVEDESLRSAVLSNFEKDPSLAELLRKEFSASGCWDGIVEKLWRNVEIIDAICTGAMEVYFPIVKSYAGQAPLILSAGYASTEGVIGVNLEPSLPANQTSYVLLPHAAYYEFIPVADSSRSKGRHGTSEVLDLMSLSEGEEYEVLVTTIAGLYRYKIGDVLKVVGFHNSSPAFQVMRRVNVVLTVDTDKTDEVELHTAVKKGSQLLEQELGLRLLDYTSTVDYSSSPGHYVIFWELIMSSKQGQEEKFSQLVLEKCCAAMEAGLGRIYKRGRHENIISALELRLVQKGTFDLLMSDTVSRGASIQQFKTPRGLTSDATGLKIMNARVIQSAVSREKPPFQPGIVESPPP